MLEADSDTPREFRYFLDYDKEADCLNVFAAVTNYGLFGPDERYWTGKASEPVSTLKNQGLEGYGATFFRDDSGVSWCGANREHLGPEVSEGVARKIHPTLFERKQADEERQATL